MRKIAIYGKGGIGKSTTQNIVTALAQKTVLDTLRNEGAYVLKVIGCLC